LAALHFQETDPVPYTLPVEDSVADRLDGHYGGTEWRQRLEQHIGVVRMPGLRVDEAYGPVDPFGTVWLLIPFGTPDEIRAEIGPLRREMGSGGGYILAPAKPLMPEVPLENAVAVVEAFVCA
jgi:hypothetical protein